ncbi:MAG: hypothetical protein CMC76_09130 [Flavobacteriaceae bacterium]|nr:hypothetical protein [Flavobacteriaceae bacterium]|tara:strand:+ start:361 stop:600 length:240 start_codon:yes stop_codon:yes gene_type:complete
MSLAGIGNAATGTLLADTITKLLTSEKNKPATKGDLISIIEKLNARYHPIKNLPANHLGDYPYYDMQEGIVIYIRVNNY